MSGRTFDITSPGFWVPEAWSLYYSGGEFYYSGGKWGPSSGKLFPDWNHPFWQEHQNSLVSQFKIRGKTYNDSYSNPLQICLHTFLRTTEGSFCPYEGGYHHHACYNKNEGIIPITPHPLPVETIEYVYLGFLDGYTTANDGYTLIEITFAPSEFWTNHRYTKEVAT